VPAPQGLRTQAFRSRQNGGRAPGLWYGIIVSLRKVVEREDADRNSCRWTSDRDLSEFLLHVCHDLRTSLRAIQAHAELLQRPVRAPETPAFEPHIGFIVDGARRIDSLAAGLSSYSIALQIEEASFQITRLDVTLRTVLARLDGELRVNGADVSCGELPSVFGNPDRLAQIFEILLHNALRHRTELSPRIDISAEKRAEDWLFAVRDNGPGIETTWLESIFKPLKRLHGKEREGVGMGLTVCRAIVERHGGRLWAESKPGTGSTFLFTLPVVRV
jgi:signal transduction histidine kinase